MKIQLAWAIVATAICLALTGILFDVGEVANTLFRSGSVRKPIVARTSHEQSIRDKENRLLNEKRLSRERGWLSRNQLLFVGDSMMELPWAEIMGREDVTVRAISGLTSFEVNRAIVQTIDWHPRTVVLLVGTNDVYYNKVPLKLVASEIVSIVRCFSDRGSKVILLAVPYFGNGAFGPERALSTVPDDSPEWKKLGELNRRVTELNLLVKAELFHSEESVGQHPRLESAISLYLDAKTQESKLLCEKELLKVFFEESPPLRNIEEGVFLVDWNQIIAPKGYLEPWASKDGTHPYREANEIFSKILDQILEEDGI